MDWQGQSTARTWTIKSNSLYAFSMVSRAGQLTRRGAASRERIVDAAADVMLERGVAGTSLDEVLAASGTSKSQLYHYFDDKDDLTQAVVRRQTERVIAAQFPDEEALTSVAAFRRWRDRIVDLQRRGGFVGGCPVGSLANELAESGDDARAVLQDCFATWQAHVFYGLQTMQARGRLRPDADPDAMAESIMAALQGGLLLAKVHRTSRPLTRALDMAIEHVRQLTT
jgi:TetR/AcrR family transcriptional regulator, transcriptional repressor for nem operon